MLEVLNVEPTGRVKSVVVAVQPKFCCCVTLRVAALNVKAVPAVNALFRLK